MRNVAYHVASQLPTMSIDITDLLFFSFLLRLCAARAMLFIMSIQSISFYSIIIIIGRPVDQQICYAHAHTETRMKPSKNVTRIHGNISYYIPWSQEYHRVPKRERASDNISQWMLAKDSNRWWIFSYFFHIVVSLLIDSCLVCVRITHDTMYEEHKKNKNEIVTTHH